jgi:hypothetical protein
MSEPHAALSTKPSTPDIQKFILPGIAGILLIIFAAVATFAKFEVGAGAIILLIFGATLMSIGLIDNIKFDGTGFQLQTLKDTAKAATEVLVQHEQAIAKLNTSLDGLTKLVKEDPQQASAKSALQLDKILESISANNNTLATSSTLNNHLKSLTAKF